MSNLHGHLWTGFWISLAIMVVDGFIILTSLPQFGFVDWLIALIIIFFVSVSAMIMFLVEIMTTKPSR